MNRYPAWKYLLLICVVAMASAFALPNIYGDNPAVQIRARNAQLDLGIEDHVATVLKNAGIQQTNSFREGETLVISFASPDEQLKAQDVLKVELGNRHTVALNLVPATPDWLRSFASPMFLGLDLRGGVHFLMQVDMEASILQAHERYVGDFRTFLRDSKIRYQGVQHKDGQLRARFASAAIRDKAIGSLSSEFRDLDFTSSEDDRAWYVNAALNKNAALEEQRAALQQNIVTLRNRVNELGVAEPVIQQQGRDRIVIQLPGVQDTGRAKEILGATATLEYRLAYGSATDWFDAEKSGRTPAKARLYRMRDDQSPVLLKRSVIVTGDQIKDASSGIDQQSGSPAVFVNLDGPGAKRMQKVTADNVGNLMAVVYIENRIETVMVDGKLVKKRTHVEEVISMANIRDVLSHRFQTTGLGANEARNLALLLRAGALKTPIEIIEERTVGPSLGQENIDQGLNSVLIGLALVLVFMVIYYRMFGLIANVALVLNLVIIVAVLSSLQATLTLPGIAGIVLTVGMAVDANVLIFERIKEELRQGAAIQSAINAGYEKAVATIADANITTLIAAIVLFSFGTGSIKGFAITLSIGILTSMFTAIMGTRALVNLIYGGRKVKRLPI